MDWRKNLTVEPALVVRADNLATIHHSEIDRVFGTLAGLKAVDAALRTTLAV
jgi:hypothetical protein